MGESRAAQAFAVNLDRLMQARGMTQAQLAKKAELGQTTISLYLRPEARNNDKANGQPGSPTLAKVEAIALALGVDVWDLLRPPAPPGGQAISESTLYGGALAAAIDLLPQALRPDAVQECLRAIQTLKRSPHVSPREPAPSAAPRSGRASEHARRRAAASPQRSGRSSRADHPEE